MITIEFDHEPSIQFENPPVDLYCVRKECYVFCYYTNKYYFCGEAVDHVFDVENKRWNIATKKEAAMLIVYIYGLKIYKPGDRMFDRADRIIID